MSVSLNGTNGLTFADSTTQNTGGYTGFRNRIINGAMMIDQRNAGAAGSTINTYTVDRWQYIASQSGKFAWQQNLNLVTPPAGFISYLGFSSASAYSLGASDYFLAWQPIEGYNVADLNFGTANASTVTLSFWVYSSLTGVFGGTLRNAANDRNYVFSYIVTSANTWEQKTITIAGDTGGTWGKVNGIGMTVAFSLGVGSSNKGTAGAWGSNGNAAPTGSVDVVSTNGATFYITGVQLEKGSVATPFEFRPYGTELQLCQRYYTTSFQNGASPSSPNSLTVAQTGMYMVNSSATTEGASSVQFTVKMRTAPTVALYAPLTNPASGLIRQASNGTTVSGTTVVIGESSFVPQGGLASTAYQFGYAASAEL